VSETALHVALMRVFRIILCPACGNQKKQRSCFCKTCYFALPQKLRSGLYVSALDGDEFFDNYILALDHLIKIKLAVLPDKWTPDAQRMLDETGLSEALNQERRMRPCPQK
jgi:hypothetical protein